MPGPARTLPTVLASNTEIRGHLTGHEDIVLEGTLAGQLTLDGQLTVAVGGVMDAQAEVAGADVAGTVSGDLVASGRVVLERTAVVTGSVRAPVVVVKEGATIRGTLDMDITLPSDVGRGRLR